MLFRSSRNLMSLLEALIDKEGVLKLDSEDELLAPSLISLDGNLRRTDLVPERATSSEMTP